MTVLLAGGSSSGKSMAAQRMAVFLRKGEGRLFYAATMIPGDEEDRQRIRRHLEAREGWGFHTLETPFALTPPPDGFGPQDVVLLDSLTLLLCNHLYGGGGWEEQRLADHLFERGEKLGGLVLVSDDTFSDALRYPDSVEEYRRRLGKLHQLLAEKAQLVVRFRAGLPEVYKGRWPL